MTMKVLLAYSHLSLYKRVQCHVTSSQQTVMAEGEAKVAVDMENSAASPVQQDGTLHDDRADQGSNFKGATLELNTAGAAAPAEVEFKGTGISRDRPYSASTRSAVSTTSSKSRTSLSPYVNQTEFATKLFFAYRSGAFENAVEGCQDYVKHDLDGEIKGAWLLTEIDHWDNEREKIVILCDFSLLVVRFDFIAQKRLECKRILLHMVQTLMIGDLTYPEKSLMPARNHGGVRLVWGNSDVLGFAQKWNPWSSEIPYITFGHHPMLYNEKERETVTYNVDDFYESLVHQINVAYRTHKPGQTLEIKEGPIMIETYASLTSMIFNQSHLGFNRERGGVSY